MNIVMTIAGSDSGGGAGIQADLKTFQEIGVFGTTAITALTAQNTLGVDQIFPVTADFVKQQVDIVLRDMPVSAVKTGMLFSAEIIYAVAETLAGKDIQLIVDPVMIAKGGAPLLQKEAVEVLLSKLIPLATVVTPNIPEAEVITGKTIRTKADTVQAAQQILAMGADCVVIKGGHLVGDYANDTVFFADGTQLVLQSERIHTNQTHGTGCTFSAAITGFLAQGMPIRDAILEAKKFVHLAIANPLNIGGGHGPTNHFAYKQQQGCEVRIIESP